MKILIASFALFLSAQAFATCNLRVDGDSKGNQAIIQKIVKKKGFKLVKGEADIVFTISTQEREDVYALINPYGRIVGFQKKVIGHESFVNIDVDGSYYNTTYGSTRPWMYLKEIDEKTSQTKSIRRALGKIKRQLPKCEEL